MFLCCDLGSTIADWGIFDSQNSVFVYREKIPTNAYSNFYDMLEFVLEEYSKLASSGKTIKNSTFGMAGPTNHSVVQVTNIENWEINVITVNSILSDHGHSEFSSIINDFEALGYGVLYAIENGIKKELLTPIHGRFQSGPARPGENRGTRSLICGPGTGLGVAGVVEGLMKDGYPYIISSEGGHHTLAPESPEQLRLLSLSSRFNAKVSYEDVLSHEGLKQIYNFYRKEDYSLSPVQNVSSYEIIAMALNSGDRAASDAIDLFCDILANFCGNTALTFNTDNNIFLWGGVLTKMPVDLLKARFKRSYADRCKLSHRVRKLSVVLINDSDLPLLGCIHRSKFEIEHHNK